MGSVLPSVVLTAALVVNLAAVVLSLGASYIPGFRVWWAGLQAEAQQLGMLIVMTLVCVIVGILSRTGVWVLIPGGMDGLIWLALLWVQALIVNQGTYTLTKHLQLSDAKTARRNRGAGKPV